jgi:malonyl-CoA O-methyltransferase
LRRAFDRLAAGYAEHAGVPREIERRLIEHLDAIRLNPKIILDLGSGPGEGASLLNQRYPDAQVIALDFAPRMLLEARTRHPKLVCANVGALPIRAQCADLLYSNLMLPWYDDRPALFAALRRVMKPGGLILFSTLGPGSLTELRPDSRATIGRHFADLHDIGDELMAAGWRDPVMEAEWLAVSYSSPQDLLRELRQLGGFAAQTRDTGLAGRRRLGRLTDALETLRTGGRIAVDLELIYGHAWALADDHGRFEASGSAPVTRPLLRRRTS